MDFLEINEEGSAIGGLYNLNPNDSKPDNWIEVAGDACIGWSWNGTNWNSPLPSMDAIRYERNKLLSDSDWRDLPSYPGNDRIAWRAYRDKLRSLPQDFASVADIEFPIEPNT